ERYFNQTLYINKNMLSISLIISCVIIFIVSIRGFKYYKIKSKLMKKRNKIIWDLKNNNYLLYYQPIINPKTNEIKGFEGLIRLKRKDEIISPYVFLKDIENTNMMSEVSLWVLKKAISDYDIIKNYNCINNIDFYISINLSFREIEDEKFIDKIKVILEKSELKPNSICLEIVEKFAITDINKIQDSIYKLKEAGFSVAIDDFGVEYSNLDILEKVDCDVVKLDKYFIDDIKDSFIRQEVVNFISNICKYTNKTLVCEGVETKYQKCIIKNIDNDKFYIQGYYYSKPLRINELKDFNIE
ncbi:MAG: EAL domain-containing protein, partial [Peptostreptococcaceae bacterium]